MKKILTLMAAMSACAGQALAADYVWSVDNTGNITADVKGDIAFADNQFTFSVDSGEKVWVKGTNVTVTFGGAKLTGTETTFDMEGTGMLYSPAGSGKVTVTLGEGSSIEKIKVVGSASMKLEGMFVDVQNAIKEANRETAKWAGENSEFLNFFTAVRAQINDQGRKNQALRAELEKHQKENRVDDYAIQLERGFDNVKKAVATTLSQAKNFKATYDNIVGTDVAAINAQLETGKKKPSSAEVNRFVNTANDKLVYIYDWEYKDGTIQKVAKNNGLKTSWVETEWESFNTDIANIKADALAELGKFPLCFKSVNRAAFQARYKTLQDEAKNVIARAIFERDHKDNILKLNDQMAKIEKIAATSDAPFQLPGDPAAYENYKQVVSELAIFVNADNDRRKVEQKDLNALVTGQYNSAKAAFDKAEADFVNQAIAALKTKAGEIQKSLDDTSYKISAKYANEPNTQKIYEAKFAEIQQNLDKAKDTYVASTAKYKDDVVRGYQEGVAALAGVSKDIDAQWNETLTAQKKEVLGYNETAAAELLGLIEDVRSIYNDNVLRIKKWVDASWTGSDVDVKLNANLNQLFSVAGGVDKMKEDVEADHKNRTDLINATSDIEFNANDNKYRLLDGKDKVVEFKKNIEDVKASILAELEDAVFTANKAAADHLKGTPRKTALNAVSTAQRAGQKNDNLWPGAKNERMSGIAVGLFQKEYGKIAFKDLSEKDEAKQGFGYVGEADAIIAAGYVEDESKVDIEKQKLADIVGDVEAILKKVPVAVNDLTTGALKDYTELYAAIYEQKIDWNIVKAETAKWQKGVGDAFDVTERLKELNQLFDGVKDVDGATEDGAYTTLEKGNNPVNAASLKDEIGAKIDLFKAGLYEIRNYPNIQKNNKFMSEVASKDIESVKAELASALESVKAYDEAIQKEAAQQLNAAQQMLDEATSAIETACKNLSLVDNYTSGENLKQKLTDVSDEIKAVLEWAAEQAKDVAGDLNGDKKVDAADAAIVVDNIANGTMTTADYTDFLRALLEYNKDK